MIDIPKGFRIERSERLDTLREERAGRITEVRFEVVDARSGDVVTDPSVRWQHFDGDFTIHPGFSSASIEPEAARARAAGLLTAAEECERLREIEAGS